jgi:RNA polymerase sigma-70 factor (ECF subfamily)
MSSRESQETAAESPTERFKRLAWPYLPMLLRTARYLSRRDDEAEDLVQETMLKALKAINSFEDGTDVKAWLMTILRRTHIDVVRARQRRPVPTPLGSVDAAELAANKDALVAGVHDGRWRNPQELLERFEDQTVIDALQDLPEAIRWTLMLVDVEQMDQTEAAGVLGVPVGTIKSRAHRGRQMLRDRLFEVAKQRGWVK